MKRAAPSKALRRVLAKQRRDEKIRFREIFDACLFHSVVGLTLGHLSAASLIDCVGATIALIEDKPSPFDPHVMARLQAELAAGRTVLILASDREVRDCAKKVILGMVLPVRGSA